MNSRSLAETGDLVESPGHTRPKDGTKSKRAGWDTRRSSFIVASVPRRTIWWLFGQPVDSTGETNAWLGLIAMLQGQNEAK